MALLVLLGACLGGPQRRPAGFLNLGKVAELAGKEESFFSDLKIFLRRDAGGFFAMSTACTYDLSPLFLAQVGAQRVWRSQRTESMYALDGTVLHGPTKHPLPFYKLEMAPGLVGGPRDTLFVEVGIERPSSWRLPVP